MNKPQELLKALEETMVEYRKELDAHYLDASKMPFSQWRNKDIELIENYKDKVFDIVHAAMPEAFKL